MATRKKRATPSHKKSKNDKKKLWYWLLLGVVTLLLLSAVAAAVYIIGYENIQKTLVQEKHTRPLLNQETSIIPKKEPHEEKKLVKELQSLLETEQNQTQKELQEDYKTNYTPPVTIPYIAPKKDQKSEVTVLQKVPKHPVVQLDKPRLAIIFDDVSTAAQVKAIHGLSFKVTPSFFPPAPRHPKTPQLAEQESVYMVHLPLEAMIFSNEEVSTLRVHDSLEQIDARIKQVLHWFPRVTYINNHTGSKFTSDVQAMDKLIKSCIKYGITFIDSRTTAQTVVPQIDANYHLPYIARNVFLDHEADIGYIRNQLKKAVAYAKEHGEAIAIGHPRKLTLKALQDVDDILKDVECVTIDNL